MRRIKITAIEAFITLCKISLPKKYFDDIFIAYFLRSEELNKLKLRNIIWCFIHGFLPFEYLLYGLEKNDYRNYLPARNNFQRRKLNGAFNAILANKILFEKHIKTVINGIDKLHVVESIGYIEGGYLQPLHKDVIHGNFSSLIPFLEKNDLILKPISGDGGIGVFRIKKVDDNFLLDNKKTGWDEIIAFLKNLNDYLIQEKLIQRGFSNKIYEGAVNSMRIATMIDPVTQQPFIAYAAHRFGSLQSNNVDNVNQGGIAALIDLTDGTLSMGRSFFGEREKDISDLHPDSSKPIYNEKILNWNNLINRLIEMAGRMPYLKYVGWDIILSDDELYVLEGNVSPHLGIIQMFKPMTDFPSAWNFYRHYKYIN